MSALTEALELAAHEPLECFTERETERPAITWEGWV